MKSDSPAGGTASSPQSLVDSVGFDLLGDDLGRDVETGLTAALNGGAVFQGGTDPLSIFRKTLQESIRGIETHARGRLLQRFLRDGPYEGQGRIPAGLREKRLTDGETAEAIGFIYAFMVNSFKGALTELLAAYPCQRLVEKLCLSGVLASYSRLYVGDAVSIFRADGRGVLKGADLHVLAIDHHGVPRRVGVAGVAEVKSGYKSKEAMRRQVERHILRTRHGLRVDGVDYPSEAIRLNSGPGPCILRITVLPSDWRLPIAFRFEPSASGRRIRLDRAVRPFEKDLVTQLKDNQWHITLRASKEEIAQAAYEMTFWYMEKVGEVIYASQDEMLKDWAGMSPAEAGINAVKMMLYYAIRRCRGARENQRAIALYNTYGFGYALGMNFKNKQGRREMLWPEDLDEILASGKTRGGCRIGRR